jgi:hypothetical protein
MPPAIIGLATIGFEIVCNDLPQPLKFDKGSP